MLFLKRLVQFKDPKKAQTLTINAGSKVKKFQLLSLRLYYTFISAYKIVLMSTYDTNWRLQGQSSKQPFSVGPRRATGILGTRAI